MKKLHFGCFDQVHEGWINTDITPHIWIARIPFLARVLHRLGYMSDVAAYDVADPDKFCSAMFESSQATEKNQHHWMYNEESMRRLLTEVGFREVYRCQYRQGRSSDVSRIDNRPGSLFMEAVK